MGEEEVKLKLYHLILELDDGEPHQTATGGLIGLAEYHAEIVASILAKNPTKLINVLQTSK